VAQTFATIAPYTIEEAYEVADAIERDDMADLREELGDLLLQVVFHSRMAQEAGTSVSTMSPPPWPTRWNAATRISLAKRKATGRARSAGKRKGR
jgi:hypothetical protein